MSENETNQEKKQVQIVITGQVPYIAMLQTILRTSQRGADYFESIEKIMASDEAWELIYNKLEDDMAHKNCAFYSFEKAPNTIDLSVTCMMMSASNTFSASKKDVIMTTDTVFVTHMIMEQAWAHSDNAFKPVRNMGREEFKSTVLTISKTEHPVFAVNEEIALLHGYFSRDTWNLLRTIIGPVDLPKEAYASGQGDDAIYGLMLLLGESFEALAMLADKEDSSWEEHVTQDFEKIMHSFGRGTKENETDNVISSKEDK